MSEQTKDLAQQRRIAKSLKCGNAEKIKHYLCREVKRSIKDDKDRYIQGLCVKVEQASMQQKTRLVYDGIRRITGKMAKRTYVIKDYQGNILAEPLEVRKRWKEYLDELYNVTNQVDSKILERFPESASTESIPDIIMAEVQEAIKNLKSGKAPGVDNISTEEMKAATRGKGAEVILNLCRKI